MMARRKKKHPMIGATVENYRIVEQLGVGGMGIIYRAEDTRLGRSVALKFLPPELTHRREAKDRFLQEAKAASALDHPNICTIYQIAETAAGQLFIAMACYEGESLKDRMARGRLSEAEAIELARQVASGLAESHARDIVHRDIKPANLWCTRSGLVKILDFGLAKVLGQVGLTRTGSSMGTPAYMSPEQTRGERVDARSDLWSLGVVLYEALAGRLPFDGKNVPSILYAIHAADPPDLATVRPDLSPELVTWIHRLLAKDPEDRPVDAQALGEELAVLSGETPSGSMERLSLPPTPAPALRLLDPPGDAERDSRADTPVAGSPAAGSPAAGSPAAGSPGSGASRTGSRFAVSPPGGVRQIDPAAALRPREATVLLDRPWPPATTKSAPNPSGAASTPIVGEPADDYDQAMARGIEAALARDYPRAEDGFTTALEHRPGDPRAEFNLRRIRNQAAGTRS